MSSQSDPRIAIKLYLNASDPRLLEGLEAWVHLGLLDDRQVRNLCRTYLSHPLPQQIASEETATPEEPPRELQTAPPISPEQPTEDGSQGESAPVPGTGLLHSLKAELSVRWLLFLGVFMVLLSSGVLAATQWERFPAAGQYLVLFTYTIMFWGTSQWAGKQERLRLTAQTLQLVTLLLVPVNFWAMDGFGLWNSLAGWGAIAIAAPVLSGIIMHHFKQSPSAILPFTLYGVPCYLHWGWGLTGWPFVAVYLSAILTALGNTFLGGEPSRHSDRADAESDLPPPPPPQRLSRRDIFLGLYATAVVLGRAIFIIGVPLDRFGLAIGICGWILAHSRTIAAKHASDRASEADPRPRAGFSESLWGGSLLALGWAISVWTLPWQAIAVSALALWWLSVSLRWFFRVVDFIAICAIGLQAYWLMRELIPPVLRNSAIATGTQLAQAQENPWVLFSLTLFPYLLLMVWLTDWLYCQAAGDRHSRARTCGVTGDFLCLGLGLILVGLALANPRVLTITLYEIALTLALVTYRRLTIRTDEGDNEAAESPIPQLPHSAPTLIYLTHITGLLALLSSVNWAVPNLPMEGWASLLLALAIAEWGISLALELRTRPPWVQLYRTCAATAWYLGLGVVLVSYYIFTYNIYQPYGSGMASEWGLLWSIAPVGLTAIAYGSRERSRGAAGLSIAAALAAQLLTLETAETRAIALGIATAVMLLNTRILRETVSAAIAIGCGLSFIAQILALRPLGLPPVVGEDWLVVGASAIGALALTHTWLMHRRTELSRVYARAAEGWGNALLILEVSVLTLHSFTVYQEMLVPSTAVLIASVLTTGAIAYRLLQDPSAPGIYTLAWSLELLSAEMLGLFDRSWISLAVANVLLGAIAFIVSEWWMRRTGRELPHSWNGIPLFYGILGVAFRGGSFTSWSGLTSFGLAAIAIGIGRRYRQGKPLVYIGLLGCSLAAYELLYYQVASMYPGDRLIAMAALGAGIVYEYRLLAPWLSEFLPLSAQELAFLAHLHWGLSSTLLASAIVYPISSTDWVGLGTGIFLSHYAIARGRHHANPDTAQLWVYLGILEAAGIVMYLVMRLPSDLQAVVILWGGAIACLVAYFFYFLPWERWGWPQKPWRRTAIGLPAIVVFATSDAPYTSTDVAWYVSTTLSASFYIFLSRMYRQIRLTYLSVALIDWALLRWFDTLNLTDILWYITPLVASVLYFARVEPDLKESAQKPIRHLIRLFASGTFCFVILFTHHWLITGLISLGFIFAGLILRIRAFLYVGTVVFLFNAVNQLVILNALYSFLRWIVGLIVGILLIWIAATFETRREQIIAVLQNWLIELDHWE